MLPGMVPLNKQAGGSGLPEVTIFITDTALTTWTVPLDWNPGENSVECLGGGASGSGWPFNNQAYKFGPGGGGGAYAKKTNLNLTPGSSVSLSVGIGGPASGSSSHAPGGDTWFGGTLASPLVKAVGAPGGAKGVGNLGGQAANCIGDVVYSGGNGGNNTGGPNGCGGGGAAGPNGPGGNSPGSTSPGAGGPPNGGVNGASGTTWDATHGTGSGGYGGNNYSSGNPAAFYGGGGGGAAVKNNAYPSGAGRQGLIVIKYKPA